MKNRTLTSIFSMPALIFSSQGFATIEPAAIDAGPVSIIPTVNVQTSYDDNIFSSNSSEVDSLITSINPRLEVIAEDGFNAYKVTYSIDHGMYKSSSDDNYTDHNLGLDGHLEFDARNTLDLNTSYTKNHEERGTGITETGNIGANVDAPLEYDTASVSFAYTYGAQDAAGKLVFAGRYADKEYQNFRSITESRDSETTTFSGTFYYQVQPKTSLLFEVRNQDLNYKNDLTNSLDSETRRYYVGATWEGSAKTTGTIKLGQVEKDFDSSARDDFSGTSWEVTIDWEPRTYSAFKLSTSQYEKESSGAGDFIDSKTVRLTWTHNWDDQLKTALSTGYTNDDYKGTNGGREDDITDASINLTYDMRRWLSLGVGYSHLNTDSNVANIPYDRNIYFVSVTGSL
ncbi:outer membrane beta-barrel protein [Amphritea sp. 2_MG-2023]|uniref:outer membrane beta-barrel protein n=1 Tax=Amphritea TaxID=515417 RepID=UPI001C066919|nr:MULTISPECIES: outer membrane beta-barrel protein [Amphritea]MBU2965219.1 outer membrane beta-barrel protein [Amphritea atlantica]MDO6419712.1 outer membrane beta-barrel protein [Amphritea sp. 2_MG-2023]